MIIYIVATLISMREVRKLNTFKRYHLVLDLVQALKFRGLQCSGFGLGIINLDLDLGPQLGAAPMPSSASGKVALAPRISARAEQCRHCMFCPDVPADANAARVGLGTFRGATFALSGSFSLAGQLVQQPPTGLVGAAGPLAARRRRLSR